MQTRPLCFVPISPLFSCLYHSPPFSLSFISVCPFLIFAVVNISECQGPRHIAKCREEWNFANIFSLADANLCNAVVGFTERWRRTDEELGFRPEGLNGWSSIRKCSVFLEFWSIFSVFVWQFVVRSCSVRPQMALAADFSRNQIIPPGDTNDREQLPNWDGCQQNWGSMSRFCWHNDDEDDRHHHNHGGANVCQQTINDPKLNCYATVKHGNFIQIFLFVLFCFVFHFKIF